MPDEQLAAAGLGPAGVENPEEGGFATRAESLAEAKVSAAEKEVLVEGGTQEKKYEQLLSQVVTAPPSDDDTKIDLEHLHSLEGEGEKVAHLMKLANTKGLPHAVTVAQRLKDYYALDTFHDQLIDNLYDELLKQGLITKE